MDKRKEKNENHSSLFEHLAVPMETIGQVRVAEQQRKQAIERYRFRVRQGSAWIKEPVATK